MKWDECAASKQGMARCLFLRGGHGVCIEESKEDFHFWYTSDHLDESGFSWIFKEQWPHLGNSWHKPSQWCP